MKTRHSRRKDTKKQDQKEQASHPGGQQLAPPSYGLDFTENQLDANYVLMPKSDSYEKEAESLAYNLSTQKADTEKTTSTTAMTTHLSNSATAEKGSSLPVDFSQKIEEARQQSQPLPKDVQETSEKAFGTKLDHVQIHTGSSVEELNTKIGSDAFTIRDEIFAKSDIAKAETPGARNLLFHETVHTMQQGPNNSGSPEFIQRGKGPHQKLQHDPDSTEPMDAPEFFKKLKAKLKHMSALGGSLSLRAKISYNLSGGSYIFRNIDNTKGLVNLQESAVSINFWASARAHLGLAGELKANFWGLGDLKRIA